ncbi:response regulator transcription factor [Gloeobacter morelensis]|uniref:Response regulator transcription factor n=1 Tax=Gloeobacter morelensis MG652769 TaxID=2781736 RepID=A0ABY3PMW6_9CYAN|nr:response regulator transcription factor [Gloeobacter morelensis]UFP95038.1 response regulator transcription factor [Gloeobacter morelensis MG652769]
MAAHLLLVDDDPGIRLALQAYLEDEGFGVTTARNAIEGLELAEKHQPDLVITDIMMPQVDGYRFLQKLRALPRFRYTPVVFLTAKGQIADRIQGYRHGCDAYLPKPGDPEELVAIVRNLLDRSRQVQSEIVSLVSELNHRPAPVAIEAIDLDLTPREQEVLLLVYAGLMNKEIAGRLERSTRNVEKYVSRLLAKTGTSSRTELVRFALEHGLVSPGSAAG